MCSEVKGQTTSVFCSASQDVNIVSITSQNKIKQPGKIRIAAKDGTVSICTVQAGAYKKTVCLKILALRLYSKQFGVYIKY